MSATAVTERPTRRAPNGGVPARRAVIRWAIRLLRREWRQQLLILALITVAVGATVVASTVATDTPAPIAAVLGTAQDAASITGPPATINAGITRIESLYGQTDVIENETVPVPGTQNTFDVRAQNPRGPFGGPLLNLVSGQYPATANEIAVTGGVAADFHLNIGSSWTVAGRTWKVTGIVANPQSLLDEFALVIPGQVTNPSDATVLFDAPGTASAVQQATHLNVTTAQTVANTNEINPETISVAAAVLGMLLIALVGIGGFTVLAQRRLRAIGMLAAQGATQRNIRLVIRANGAATGVVGAVAGLVLGFLAWLAYRPQAENSAHHLMGAFQLPWTVIGISMVLAVIATYFAASRPAKAIARTPIVAALAGRPPAPRKTRHLAVPVGVCFLIGAFLLLGAAGAGVGGGGNQSNGMQEIVVGFVALAVAIVLLAPALLSVVAAAGKHAPIATRLALRDLARYRARSGPALAAISLATLIAVIICVLSAARFGNVLDYAGPNLTSSQLIVYAPVGPLGQGNRPGPGSSGPTAAQMAAGVKTAQEIAADLGTTSMIALETSNVGLQHAAPGRSWSGQIYVATPQLLKAFGISQSEINPDADFLTMRPGLSTTSLMQLTYGNYDANNYGGRGGGGPNGSDQWPCPAGSCIANPPIQEISQLPSGTSAPEHGGHRARDHHPAPAELGPAQRLADHGAGRPHPRSDHHRPGARGRGTRQHEHRDPQQHPVAGADRRRGHDLRAGARARHPRPERRPGAQRGRARPAHPGRHRGERRHPPHDHGGDRGRARAHRRRGRDHRRLPRGDRLLPQQFARRPVLADQHPGDQPAGDPGGHAARRDRPRLAAGRPRPSRHRPPATRIARSPGL